MKHIHYFFILTFFNFAFYTHAVLLRNDQEAYTYCTQKQQSFIAIMWPIAQGHDSSVTKIFNRYGEIKYRKDFYFTPQQALTILQQAHPHITNMQEHLNWYFPPGTYQKPARIFVLKFPNARTAVTCKHEIRKLYPLQYRSIHINDTHNETKDLARSFFSKKFFNEPRITLKMYCNSLLYLNRDGVILPIVSK